MPRKITCHRVVLSFETDSELSAKEIIARLLAKIAEDQTPTDGDPWISLGQLWVAGINLRLDEDCTSADIDEEE